MKIFLFIIALLTMALSTSQAKDGCFNSHIIILTEEGKKPDRSGIPMSITNRKSSANEGQIANTNSNGFLCIKYSGVDEGERVILKLGENDDNHTWSSWKIISPYNGVVNIPNSNVNIPQEIIIVKYAYYKSLLHDAPISPSLGKNCKYIYKFPHVQVSAYRKRYDAEKAQKNLITNGFQACVGTRFINNKKWHRVLVTTGSKNPIEVCNTLKVEYGYKQCDIKEP